MSLRTTQHVLSALGGRVLWWRRYCTCCELWCTMAVLLDLNNNRPAMYGDGYKKMHSAEADVLERCAA
jgi:hypothetical protein